MKERTGEIIVIQDSLVRARFFTDVKMLETAQITVKGNKRLKAEVLKVMPDPTKKGNGIAEMQVFEDLTGAKIGDGVVFDGEMLSVLLGPGLLGSTFDGLQQPLYELAKEDPYLLAGMRAAPLNEETLWEFTPTAKVGSILQGGDMIGYVPEGRLEHKILVPFNFENVTLKSIIEKSEVNITQQVAIVVDQQEKEHELKLAFPWPVKKPIPFKQREVPTKPISTGVRVIDMLAPVMYGGTVGNPGPFGAGKTVLQHSLCKYAEADIVIMAACGERAGEAVEVFKDFAELKDPSTGGPLMDRMVIFGNTSSMPVAAREASVFIALTVAEYYRYEGYNGIMLADSTSRWAQALRERAGRQGDIPGPEAFPMNIPDQVKGIYQRAGVDVGTGGSLTFIGTVSPAGGNFAEPVTRATLDATGGFWGLSQDRADARRYPAIDVLVNTKSDYEGHLSMEDRLHILDILQDSKDIQETISTIGLKKVPVEHFIVAQKGLTLDSCILQQNAFDDFDACTRPDRIKYINEVAQMLIDAKISFTPPEEMKDEAFKVYIEGKFDRLREWWRSWNMEAKTDEEIAKLKPFIQAFVEQKN